MRSAAKSPSSPFGGTDMCALQLFAIPADHRNRDYSDRMPLEAAVTQRNCAEPIGCRARAGRGKRVANAAAPSPVHSQGLSTRLAGRLRGGSWRLWLAAILAFNIALGMGFSVVALRHQA